MRNGMTEKQGVALVIEKDSNLPNVVSEHIPLYPHSSTFVGLVEKNIRRLKSPYPSNCTTTYPERYKTMTKNGEFHFRYRRRWNLHRVCSFPTKSGIKISLLRLWVQNIRLSGPWKITKGVWPSFLPSGARLKNCNAERRHSRSLALWICDASVASNHKLAKAQGCFEGSRQCILSREKTTPSKIPIKTIWPRNFYPLNVTKNDFKEIWLIHVA